ncbi:Fatty acyl-CoA reductase 2, partial [Camponotus floridanus]
ISAFYAGRSVLISGCTGFLSKVLCKKLLRSLSCPNTHTHIAEIFVLIRPKKQLNVNDR